MPAGRGGCGGGEGTGCQCLVRCSGWLGRGHTLPFPHLPQPHSRPPCCFLIALLVQTKWAFKQEHRQRRLGQIFIKGDSVVTVSLESQYRPVACASARQPERIEQRG
eukprot:358992-Chlamydomonas_euryale.AAC.2